MRRVKRLRPVRLLGRWLRFLVLVLAVVGLAPVAAAVEVVEVLAGAHAEGLVAGESCAEDCGEGCEKSGCHAGVHHCGCCAPGPRMTAESPFLLALWQETAAWNADRSRAPPSEGESPPRQPPRA